MSRSINQVEVINFAVFGFVIECRSLGLNGDAPFTLNIHRIENLRFHFAIRKTATKLNNAIGKGRFAVINVGDDRKIAD